MTVVFAFQLSRLPHNCILSRRWVGICGTATNEEEKLAKLAYLHKKSNSHQRKYKGPSLGISTHNGHHVATPLDYDNVNKRPPSIVFLPGPES